MNSNFSDFWGTPLTQVFSFVFAYLLACCLPVDKVLSPLEASSDLILGSSLSMKIKIMGGKITENLGFKSPLRKVKKIVLFSFHFQILHTKVDIFYLNHLLISCVIN